MDEVERLGERPSRFEIVYLELAVWRGPNSMILQLANERTARGMEIIILGVYIYTMMAG